MLPENRRLGCTRFTEESLGSAKDRHEQEEKLICNVVASDRIHQGLGLECLWAGLAF